MGRFLERTLEELAARWAGPLSPRFILQPAMAIFLGIRAGLNDAAVRKASFLQAVVADPSNRRALLKEGVKDLRRLCVLAFGIDLVYQVAILHSHRIGQALIITFLLAVLPYVLVRGPVSRLMRRGGTRESLDLRRDDRGFVDRRFGAHDEVRR